jgi:hypothetical protein
MHHAVRVTRHAVRDQHTGHCPAGSTAPAHLMAMRFCSS